MSNRPTNSIAASLSVLAVLLAVPPAMGASQKEQGPQAPAPMFKLASTRAEHSLDAILTLNNRDRRVFDFVVDRRGSRKRYQREFGQYFSARLLDAVSALERKFVKEECGGTYVEGDMCGIGYDPVICAVDVPLNGYTYASELSTKDTAVIATSWKADGPTLARYRMVKRRGNWIIDAIACDGGDTFNW